MRGQGRICCAVYGSFVEHLHVLVAQCRLNWLRRVRVDTYSKIRVSVYPVAHLDTGVKDGRDQIFEETLQIEKGSVDPD